MSNELSRRSAIRAVLAAGAVATLGSILPASVYAASASSSQARVKAGNIVGARVHGIHVFKGIPYGADTRPRRFLPPEPPSPWKRTREALNHGPACPQRDSIESSSEDCLHLNLWTPGLSDGARRPIMVYVHGGEYSSGSASSPLYDGTRLCLRGDVVVVTVNHRLNAFGHLYLARLFGADYERSGNAGLLDLALALQWVRDHAEAFGGDPQRVMVFGQSGGGAKIATMMAMPGARGLFQRAATMSGQQITAAGPRASTLRARAFLAEVGIRPGILGRLREVGTEHLVDALSVPDPTIPGRSLYFGPVLDHVALPRHPFYPDAPSQSAGIPMIIGNTLDETRAFHGDDPGIHTLTWNELPERLLQALHVDISPEVVIAEYRRFYPDYTPTEVFFAATTAGRSWRAAVIEAELRAAQGVPAYAYQLNFRSPLENGRYGAMHTMDIPLVFDNVAQPGSLTGASAAARRTADLMSASFIAFARNGDPNHDSLPRWTPYELQHRRTMLFDAEPSVVDDPRGAERRLFAQVPYIQRGTY